MPLQQPFGHDVESHTHWPVVVLHSCPAAQPVHVAPPVPHEPFPSDAYGSHVLPLQQPLGHEAEVQTHVPVPLHACPVAQAAQLTPPAPHWPLVSPPRATQLPPAQQPEHDPPPQLHEPLEHRVPRCRRRCTRRRPSRTCDGLCAA